MAKSIEDIVGVYMFADEAFRQSAKEWSECMGKLDAARREQVEWALELVKSYERMCDPIPGCEHPAVAAMESGICSRNFKSHVSDVVYWMKRRAAEADGKSLTQDECLDRLDGIYSWLAARHFKTLPMPGGVRDALREADRRWNIAVTVSREVNAAKAA